MSDPDPRLLALERIVSHLTLAVATVTASHDGLNPDIRLASEIADAMKNSVMSSMLCEPAELRTATLEHIEGILGDDIDALYDEETNPDWASEPLPQPTTLGDHF